MGVRPLPQNVAVRQCKGALQVMYGDSLNCLYTVFFLTLWNCEGRKTQEGPNPEVLMSPLFLRSVVV